MQELQKLMDQMAVVWQCDDGRYPELQSLDEQGRQRFIVKHQLLHATKSIGKIADLCEDADHMGYRVHVTELRRHAVKLFVNAVKLAQESGMSAAKLFEEAYKIVQ